jgi:hypothetical protein
MTPGTLVLIDLHWPYIDPPKDRGWDIEAIKFNAVRLTRLARQLGFGIVRLETWQHSGYFSTIPEIMSELEGYNLVDHVMKRRCNGGPGVAEACGDRFSTDLFWSAGIQAGICVRETSEWLATRFPQAKVDVLQSACNNDPDEWKRYVHPRVRLVRNLKGLTIPGGLLQRADWQIPQSARTAM